MEEEPTPIQSLHNIADWFFQHKTLAETRGAEIDLLILPQDAEAAMVAALMSEVTVKEEECRMVERKDNTVRIYLMGVPVKFTNKLPGNFAWFRYKGGRSG